LDLDPETSLLEVAERLAEAERTGDIGALKRLLAPDYQGYDPAGRPLDRERVLREFAEGKVRVKSLLQSQLKARVEGDTGIVSGVNAIEGVDGPGSFRFRLRFLDVYLLRDGQWQLVASQDTLLPGWGAPVILANLATK
jgi:uncharacterized protein DUF4440